VGTWGTGLYATDFAADLRETIRAVARLPFDADRLAAIVVDTERQAASNPDDEDHTNFWLVLADQFLRRGLVSADARDHALRIIDTGADLEMQRKLGRDERGLRKRRQILEALRTRLASAAPPIARKPVLRKPESFLMDVGDVLIYPTCGGRPQNPYAAHPDRLKIYGPKGGQVWTQDGWGAITIVDRGRAFDYFAWYTPLVVHTRFDARPEFDTIAGSPWSVALAGTCSPTHFRRMALERVGQVHVSAARMADLLPGLRNGDTQAIGDVSIANRMTIRSGKATHLKQRPPFDRIVTLGDLAD
jgi:hypothetical protein